MGIFNRKQKDEYTAKILKNLKELEKNSKHSLMIAEYGKALGISEQRFHETIALERLNALERRERHIGDYVQKERIHDAAVGLLAIEEARFELRSVSNAQEFNKAIKRLEFVLRHMQRMDSNVSITKKELREEMTLAFDNSTDTTVFAERAEKVDEQFVEFLIQGYTFDECLEKKYHVPAVGGAAPSGPAFDFSSEDPAKDKAQIDATLGELAGTR